MKMKHLALAGFVAAALAQPGFAKEGLTQGQSSARLALVQYGYTNVDVTRLNSSQLAQIHYLVGSGEGSGRIRGQIGAILRRSHIWDLQRK